MRGNGVDAIGTRGGLLMSDATVIELPAASWDGLAAADALETVRAARNIRPARWTKVQTGTSVGFVTREGATGVLQVVDADLPRRGVAVRYKLIDQAPYQLINGDAFVPKGATNDAEVHAFQAITPYPLLPRDGSEATYPDLMAVLPVVRQTAEYQDWLGRKDIHAFNMWNVAGYRFEALFGGRATMPGGGGLGDLVMEIKLFRPDGTLLARSIVGNEHAPQREISVFDEAGTRVTARVHWRRSSAYPAGRVESVVENPGTPEERTIRAKDDRSPAAAQPPPIRPAATAP